MFVLTRKLLQKERVRWESLSQERDRDAGLLRLSAELLDSVDALEHVLALFGVMLELGFVVRQ